VSFPMATPAIELFESGRSSSLNSGTFIRHSPILILADSGYCSVKFDLQDKAEQKSGKGLPSYKGA
ncbi:MAG: hypothetical protein KAJ05_01760, partial [Candidatus Latescibacteria bacterium]|nr:hypothetical protein [Candidatus Latescibacterota bacterium]